MSIMQSIATPFISPEASPIHVGEGGRLRAQQLREWAQRRGGRLLVVDDSPVERAVTASALGKVGFKVLMATGGQEAVDIVRDSLLPFDVIVMDMSMPGVDGLTATRAIRSMPDPRRSVPIIALTANALPEDRAACLAAGMNDYATKPLQMPVLLDAMRAQMSLRCHIDE